MPRFCNRCQRPLLTKTGAPEYRRHFCSRECKNEDSKDRKVARRKHIPGKKCPLCGRKAGRDLFSNTGVSPDTAPGEFLMQEFFYDHSGKLVIRCPEVYEQRFWARVDKNGPVPAHNPNLGACWLWITAKGAEGYGLCRDVTGRVDRPHRISYRIAFGAIPEGKSILHKCDTPNCVNPSHIYPGTQRQNVVDRVSRKRSAIGEHHGSRVLTEVQVLEIRKMFASGMGSPAIARTLGLKYMTVYEVATRRTWTHL